MSRAAVPIFGLLDDVGGEGDGFRDALRSISHTHIHIHTHRLYVMITSLLLLLLVLNIVVIGTNASTKERRNGAFTGTLCQPLVRSFSPKRTNHCEWIERTYALSVHESQPGLFVVAGAGQSASDERSRLRLRPSLASSATSRAKQSSSSSLFSVAAAGNANVAENTDGGSDSDRDNDNETGLNDVVDDDDDWLIGPSTDSVNPDNNDNDNNNDDERIRYRARLAYDGSGFSGFQITPNKRTVQVRYITIDSFVSLLLLLVLTNKTETLGIHTHIRTSTCTLYPSISPSTNRLVVGLACGMRSSTHTHTHTSLPNNESNDQLIR